MALSEDEDGFWARRDGLELRVEGGARPRQRSRTFFEEAGVMVRIETGRVRLARRRAHRARHPAPGWRRQGVRRRPLHGVRDPDGNLFELIETPNGAG